MNKVNIDFEVILENIASPILLVEPLKNKNGEYDDFFICYMNEWA